MANRLGLHNKLVKLLGSNHVYFNPPETIKMEYPCIVYERKPGMTTHADDMPYLYDQLYSVTYISKTPDDGMVEKLAYGLAGSRHEQYYKTENLHHDAFVVMNTY